MLKNHLHISVFIVAIVTLLFSGAVFITSVSAEDVEVEGYDYRLDLPESWEIYDAEDLARISFTDPTHNIVLQVVTYPGDRFFKAAEIYETVKQQLKAEGEGDGFFFELKDSFFADMTFSAGKSKIRGYFLFINTLEHDYGVFCFTSMEFYDQSQGLLLSAIDSFSLNKEGLLRPGPVSQYYAPFPGPDRKEVKIPFDKTPLTLLIDENEVDASQVLIEREAIVLASYKDNQLKAWERFYRMIYRDTYHRLDQVYTALENEYQKSSMNKKEMIVNILKWIQDFSYGSTGTISDIRSPLDAVIKHEGDCDSRGLLYLILLHHMKADAVLFVSPQFKHSGVGLLFDILKKKGAVMEVGGKKYLFAELTTKVDIGMIAQDLADPKAWIPIKLGM